MDRWPHQIRGVQQVIQSIHSGIRRVLLTCPTGGGKTVIMSDLITWGVENGLPVSLYTNRKMLIEQTSAVLSRLSIDHGIRASGHESNHHRTVQVSSIQTEHVRCIRSSRWDLHPAGLVLVDEAHMQKSGMAQEILSRHAAQGASIVGLTATPIGLADMYDHLIVAGTNSELRQCGALLPCMHYGPDEPDLKHVRKVPLGEDLSEQQVRSIIMVPGVFARVITWFKKLNPEYKPTILFAPGVKESIYFAEELTKAGITAAHIDGDDIWLDGSLTRSDRETRSSVLEASRTGKVKVLCNRFVLREGVDAPWLAHGIFATVFGSLQSYLQSGGRLLRSHPSLRQVTIQDHGGCLDDKTEVMTRRGWVGCDGIQDDDLVAGFDVDSGSISWQPILHRHDRIIEQHEEMYEAVGRCVDFRVTGNHRIVYKKRTSDGKGGVGWPSGFSITSADQIALSESRFLVPVSGNQDAAGVDLTDDELRFIGWWITDGTLTKGGRSLSITQAVHQPQIKDLRDCLVGCGFDFRERKRRPTYYPGSKDQIQFDIPKGTCKSRPRNGWFRLKKYLDKALSPHLEDVTRRQFEVLLHAIHLGNGAKCKKGPSYKISTGNRLFADRLQSLCVRRGFKCNVHTRIFDHRKPIYNLNIQNKTTTTLHGLHAAQGQVRLKKSYHIVGCQRVWCLANPLGTLVVRRNGKVAIVGNSWWRHGSLNADRVWRLEYTERMISGMREDRFRQPADRKDPEPIRCPQCGMVIAKLRCPCGWELKGSKRSRPVVQADGSLREHEGDIYTPRRIDRRPNGPELWKKMVYRSKTTRGDRTFKAAAALFAYENAGQWPDPTWPLTPKHEEDWYRHVKDVPKERLN